MIEGDKIDCQTVDAIPLTSQLLLLDSNFKNRVTINTTNIITFY